MNFIDKAVDVHARALDVRSRRMEVLARNIANADTPHFKARDIDFRTVLSNAKQEPMLATQKGHVDNAAPPAEEGGMRYRVPFNVAFDGNTVELNVEQSQYGKAAAEYQATVNFLQDNISGIRKALRGE